MAGKIEINRITNANIYIDGNSFLGRATEVRLPDVSAVMTEHKALGMLGKMELPAGFEKLEGEIIWNSFYKDAGIRMANPFKTYSLQCRSSLQRYGSQGIISEVPMVTFLTVMFKKNPLGSYRQHENAEFSSGFNAIYVRQLVDGDEVLELDYMSNIFRVDGEDVLEDYRNNIGG